jgi:hypothetical protein
MNIDKSYIGDSVYARIEYGTLILTTENGLPNDPSNEIFIEFETLLALLGYCERNKFYERKT